MLAQLAICYKVSLQLYSSELHCCSRNYISSLIFLLKILFSMLQLIYLRLFSWFLFSSFLIYFFILHSTQIETSSFHLSILWFMINLVPLAWHLLQQAVFLQAPPWLMYNLWYLPLASRIDLMPLTPKNTQSNKLWTINRKCIKQSIYWMLLCTWYLMDTKQ